ncbi:MAG: FlgD immunoglobulin-like domain containing protein, partial [Candidatus Krumholzibacteriia bacterium]
GLCRSHPIRLDRALATASESSAAMCVSRLPASAAALMVTTLLSAAHAVERAGAPRTPSWVEGYTLVVLDAGADLHAAARLVQSQGGAVALVVPPRLLTGWVPPASDAALLGRAGIRAIHRTPPRSFPANLEDRAAQAAWRLFARAKRGELNVASTRMPPSALPLRGDALDPGQISVERVLDNLRGVGLDLDAAVRTQGDASEPLQGTSLGPDRDTNVEPDGEARVQPPSDTGARLDLEPGLLPASVLTGNSDYMTGTVSVTLFFVESDGSGEDPDLHDWTAQGEQETLEAALAGLTFWAWQARNSPGCWVAFCVRTYFATEDARCSQWREPVLHGGLDFSSAIYDVLGNFGFTSGSAVDRATAFDFHRRLSHRTDWAYCAFLAANPTGPLRFADGRRAYAYAGGPYVVSLQRIGAPFDYVFAHESAHIFRACDEYPSGCSSCGPCYNTGVDNGNCARCNRASVSCIMRQATYLLCSWTRGQIGWWRDPCAPEPLAPPVLSSVTPAEMERGSRGFVVLEGAYFTYGMQAHFGYDIQVLSSLYISPSNYLLDLSVDPDAFPARRDVHLTAADMQTTRLTHGFSVVGVPSDAQRPPHTLVLHPVSPNPTNPGAQVSVELPGSMPVRLSVLSASGRLVRELFAGRAGPGTQRFFWDGRDAAGNGVPSGVYWVRLIAGSHEQSRKLVLVR